MSTRLQVLNAVRGWIGGTIEALAANHEALDQFAAGNLGFILTKDGIFKTSAEHLPLARMGDLIAGEAADYLDQQ